MSDNDVRKIEFVHFVFVDYPDDSMYLNTRLINLMREYADWMEEVGPMNMLEEGTIGLQSGSINWRRVPD